MFGMGSWGRVRAGGRKEEGSGGERGEYRGQGGENYDESGGVYRAPRVISLTKGTGKTVPDPPYQPHPGPRIGNRLPVRHLPLSTCHHHPAPLPGMG